MTFFHRQVFVSLGSLQRRSSLCCTSRCLRVDIAWYRQPNPIFVDVSFHLILLPCKVYWTAKWWSLKFKWQ